MGEIRLTFVALVISDLIQPYLVSVYESRTAVYGGACCVDALPARLSQALPQQPS